jgi:hypothetical protein
MGPCACACLSKHAYMRSVTLIQSSKPSGTMQLDTVMKSTCCMLEQASPRGSVPTVLTTQQQSSRKECWFSTVRPQHTICCFLLGWFMLGVRSLNENSMSLISSIGRRSASSRHSVRACDSTSRGCDSTSTRRNLRCGSASSARGRDNRPEDSLEERPGERPDDLDDIDPEWGSEQANSKCGEVRLRPTGDRQQFLNDVKRHHETVDLELQHKLCGEESTEQMALCQDNGSPPPSPPPSLLSCAHSGTDALENAIIFESNLKLDLYCLYVHCVGTVMYQTFLSFDYTLFNTQWMFSTGLLLGWVGVLLYKTLTNSGATQGLRGRLCNSLWVGVYASIALAIQICVLMRWSWPDDVSTGTLLNLYAPAFFAGCFWTSISSEMSFSGLRTSRGILFDSRRALPTFLLVTTVGALYSSPESRLTVSTYIESLSRLATMHLLLLEPVLKFVSIYVLVMVLERRKSSDLVLSICFVQGLFLISLSPAFDIASITTLTGCVLLIAVYTTRLAGTV